MKCTITILLVIFSLTAICQANRIFTSSKLDVSTIGYYENRSLPPSLRDKPIMYQALLDRLRLDLPIVNHNDAGKFNTYLVGTIKSDFVGRQQVISLNTGDYKTPVSNGLLWLPDDYYTTTKSYPLIISCPGIGEQGTNINLLLNSGQLAKRIADGWNPVSSNGTKFIVYTPQGPTGSWGWNAPHLLNFLTQLKAQYRIDSTYITGLSAGVWAEWKQLNDKRFSDQIAAICAISETAPDSYSWMDNAGRKGIPVWFICGTADDKYTIHNNIFTYYKGPKIKTDLKGVGHSAWYQAYDPKWNDIASGGRNLFDWFLWVSNYKENSPPPVTRYKDSTGYIAHDSVFVGYSTPLIISRLDSILTAIKPISSTVGDSSISLGFELQYDKYELKDTIPSQKAPIMVKNFIHDSIYRVPVIK